MLESAKNFARQLVYKTKYTVRCPGLSIRLSSQLGSNLCIGNNVSIGKNTSVSDSTLGNNVKIHDNCHIGSNTKLDSFTNVYSHCHLSNVSLGKFSYVASKSQLDCAQVGKFCSLGPQILCGSGDHPTSFTSTSPVFFSILKQCGTTFTEKNHFTEKKDIIVGHDVWIGARVFIRDGVKIGDGAIIAAGAVVVKDVPDYAIVGGVPATIIRFRFSHEVIQQLLDIQWWNWPVEKLHLAQSLFVKEDIHSFIEWAGKY